MAGQNLNRIRKGNVVKVVWRDACEGTIAQNALEVVPLQGSTSTTVTTIGRYLRVYNGYLVLDDVLHEECAGSIFFEKRAEGKWLSIPLGVILHVVPFDEITLPLFKEIKRRRTIFNQLRFIPRAKRLSTGEMSRMLYLA